MSDSPESVVRKFLTAWADPKLDELLSFFSDDALYIDGPCGTHRGVDDIKSELETQLGMGWGNAVIEVNSLVTNGTTVMLERVDRVRIAGQPFSYEVMAAFEIGTDGLITRWRDYYDLQSLTDEIATRLSPTSDSTSG